MVTLILILFLFMIKLNLIKKYIILLLKYKNISWALFKLKAFNKLNNKHWEVLKNYQFKLSYSFIIH
jgi:hypothetical protein